MKDIVVAIGGNPNSGKTTIFNELTGSRQKVGNWGGVTVEKKEGRVEFGDYSIVFVDLPGTYSLSAYSMEEIIARNFIVYEKPDVVIDIIDAGNLERNLYLAVQMIEMGGKNIFVLNMADMAEKNGIDIDKEKLGSLLGGPVIFTIGNRGVGISELIETVVQVYENKEQQSRHIHVAYGNELEEEIKKIQNFVRKDTDLPSRYSTRWLSVKLLENDPDMIGKLNKESGHFASIMDQANKSRKHVSMVFKDMPEDLIADQRYGFISGLLQECVDFQVNERVDFSQKIDKILTNKYFGLPILVFFLWVMFQVTFKIGAFPMNWIEIGIDFISRGLQYILPGGFLSSLLIDGIIGGVGGVAVFLPNILLLFLMISLFEDTGYMARAAFVTDRIMHLIGLHGKSFISMIMGFGCNVPAIMSARTLENKKDRVLTILINPLMSCSARLPVYVLVAGAFFGKNAGNVIFSLYVTGILAAVLVGRLFRKTLFRGESEPFVMELPPYRVPTLKSVMIHMWERAVIFIRKMGTVILVGSIVIWFLGAFPVKKDIPNEVPEGEKMQEMISFSFIGRIGRVIEPVFRPLGFSWREGVALITGFIAKEVIVSTLGVLYNAGELPVTKDLSNPEMLSQDRSNPAASLGMDEKDDGRELGTLLKEKSGMTPISAYAFLIFVLIYTPCLAAIAAVKQETGSGKWTTFSILYQITLAWVMAFLIVKIGGVLAGVLT
jgi:ferrous iron transport protein B